MLIKLKVSALPIGEGKDTAGNITWRHYEALGVNAQTDAVLWAGRLSTWGPAHERLWLKAAMMHPEGECIIAASLIAVNKVVENKIYNMKALLPEGEEDFMIKALGLVRGHKAETKEVTPPIETPL